ncbi:MAG: trigger factor [Paludibacter sp.]|nr:trigger factor [Paludibacter sp.]
MNITRKDVDANNAVLKINIEKNDYDEMVEKQLRDYRKKAQIPGFRPGMVPVGLLKKMYGKSIMAEQINELLNKAITNYIKENKIKMLGDLLPSEKQEENNFETQDNFEFSFDMGIAPDIKIEFSKKDEVLYYEIEIDEKTIDNGVKSYTSRFGKSETVDSYIDGAILKGDLHELDADGKMVENNGIVVENATISSKYTLKNDAMAQKLFDGKKIGESVVFNPQKTIGNEQEISYLLNISKDEAKNITADFQFLIKEIIAFTDAEINQELFDKAFGDSAIKSEEEFRDKIRENIKIGYMQDTDYKLNIDIKDFLMKKNENLTFPEEFLKRWLKTQKEMLTDEEIGIEYPKLLKSITWQLIQNQIVEDNKIEITDEEIEEEARKIGRAQFIQYGIYNIGNEVIDKYVNDMLKKVDYVQQIANRIIEDKVVAAVRTHINIENKKISLADFNKFFEN